MSAENQDCLISQALDLADSHDLNVKNVTCDGTSTNLKTMQMLGCKINEKSIGDLDGSFLFKGKTIFFHPRCSAQYKVVS